jgi:hypothetical protein
MRAKGSGTMDEVKKATIVRRALELGIIKDPSLIDHMNEPMPTWVVLDVALQLIELLDPPSISYD